MFGYDSRSKVATLGQSNIAGLVKLSALTFTVLEKVAHPSERPYPTDAALFILSILRFSANMSLGDQISVNGHQDAFVGCLPLACIAGLRYRKGSHIPIRVPSQV